mmetsp:Transcript_9847/g.27582  ORF Transcript_9847/g.27582 Transcript_9847/m.27582 type:complete len:300 (-) Transcript_9847:73-972(-)
MRRKHLRRHSVLVQIDKAAVCVVLNERRTIHVFACDESFNSEPGLAFPVWHRHRPSSYEVNFLRRIRRIELLGPSIGLELELDVIPHCLLGSFAGINLPGLLGNVCLCNIIRGARPTIFVETVITRALGRCSELLHPEAGPHRPTRPGFLLHLHDGHLVGPAIGDGIVLVADDPFGRDGRDVVLGPHILLGHKLGGRSSDLGHELRLAFVVCAGYHRFARRVPEHYRLGDWRDRWFRWFGRVIVGECFVDCCLGSGGGGSSGIGIGRHFGVELLALLSCADRARKASNEKMAAAPEYCG